MREMRELTTRGIGVYYRKRWLSPLDCYNQKATIALSSPGTQGAQQDGAWRCGRKSKVRTLGWVSFM